MIYLIFLLSFIIRAFPRVLLKNTYVSDTYFHLYCARVIRENSFRIPQKLPRVMLNHQYTYPFGYHLLLALFPLKSRLWIERFTGATFDTISTAIVYYFSRWILQESGYSYREELPLLVTILYAFSPALLE